MKTYNQFINEGNILKISDSKIAKKFFNEILPTGDIQKIKEFLDKYNEANLTRRITTYDLLNILIKLDISVDKLKEILDVIEKRGIIDDVPYLVNLIFRHLIKEGNNEKLKEIIEKLGVDINSAFNDSIGKNKELIDYLIDKVDKDADDGLAIRNAISSNNYDIATELANKGFKFGEKDIKVFIPYDKYDGNRRNYYDKDGPPEPEFEEQEKVRPKKKQISDELLDFNVKNFPENLKHLDDHLTDEQYEKYKELITAASDFDIFDDV